MHKNLFIVPALVVLLTGCSSTAYVSQTSTTSQQVINSATQQNSEPKLTSFQNDGKDYKFGFKDETGKIVIQPQFDIVKDFSEGLAVVALGSVEGPWGYINSKGDFVIKPQFDDAQSFSEGLAAVGVGHHDHDAEDSPFVGKYGFIDKTGKFVIKPQFSQVLPFSDGLAAVNSGDNVNTEVVNPNPKWNFIDKEEKFLLQQPVSDAKSFSEGLAAVNVGTPDKPQWGYLDSSGQITIKPQFDVVSPFSEGLALVGSIGSKPLFAQNGPYIHLAEKWGYIDKTGQFAIVPPYHPEAYASGGGSFQNGIALISIYDEATDTSKSVYIDKQGKVTPAPDSTTKAAQNVVEVPTTPSLDTKPVVKSLNVTLQAVEDAFPDIYFKKGNEINEHGSVTTGWRGQALRIQTVGPDDNLYGISIDVGFVGGALGGFDEFNQMINVIDKSMLNSPCTLSYYPAVCFVADIESQAWKNFKRLNPYIYTNNTKTENPWPNSRGETIKYINGEKITVMSYHEGLTSNHTIEMTFEPDDR